MYIYPSFTHGIGGDNKRGGVCHLLSKHTILLQPLFKAPWWQLEELNYPIYIETVRCLDSRYKKVRCTFHYG